MAHLQAHIPTIHTCKQQQPMPKAMQSMSMVFSLAGVLCGGVSALLEVIHGVLGS